MTRVLIVPGRGHLMPEHWQLRWSREHPEYLFVPRDDDPDYDYRLRVPALVKALGDDPAPAVLVAHSGGCITTVEWAATHDTSPVTAAMLVTPPYLDPTWDSPSALTRHVPPAMRMDPLPFPTVVVASRTDPYCPYERAEEMAAAWGSRLVDAGDAGHINTAAGYGPFPLGEKILAELLSA